MFARWRYANFSRCTEEHLRLVLLLEYSWMEAVGSHLAPKLKRHQVERDLKGKRRQLTTIRLELG